MFSKILPYQSFSFATAFICYLLLAGCSDGVLDENTNTAEGKSLVAGIVLDATFIRFASWDIGTETLTIEIATQSNDQIIRVVNADSGLAIDGQTNIYSNVWKITKLRDELMDIPCMIEATSVTRQHKVNVVNAPNCSSPDASPSVTGNQLPTPFIDSPATTIRISRGTAIQFTGSLTDPDNNGPYTFAWNFAGVELNKNITSSQTTVTTDPVLFDTPGNYTIFLHVTDATEQLSTTMAQRAILVLDGPVPVLPQPEEPTPRPQPQPQPQPQPIPPVANADKESLGRLLFFDANLSEPAGRSCATCHHPNAGWSDLDKNLPVSKGPTSSAFTQRNTPMTAYSYLSPTFLGDASPRGGQFWDGRSEDLAALAKIHLLDQNIMDNLNPTAVIVKIKGAEYAPVFNQVFGAGALDNISQAYDQLAEALMVFLMSEEMNPFSSKYDAVQLGKASFAAEEQRGFDLFRGRARCVGCHTTQSTDQSQPALFSTYRYINIGVPKNNEFPFSSLPADFVDTGLGGVTGDRSFLGKFKIPSLRNIAKTAPYSHNGSFATLKDIVHFKNTRDIAGLWPNPEVPENLSRGSMGDLQLTSAEEDDLVAFLRTLSDGFVVPTANPTNPLY